MKFVVHGGGVKPNRVEGILAWSATDIICQIVFLDGLAFLFLDYFCYIWEEVKGKM